MRSCGIPVDSASSADCNALRTIASMVTARALAGCGAFAFSSISSVRRSWSSEPQFTPMRTGFALSFAILTIV